MKKYEAEQEHSNTLEGELEELSDRQQQEIADLETKLEQEKKKTVELEEQLNIKQAQVNKLKVRDPQTVLDCIQFISPARIV